MKRIIAILFTLFIVFSLAACGNGGGESTPPVSVNTPAQNNTPDSSAQAHASPSPSQPESAPPESPSLTPEVTSTVGERTDPVPLGEAFTTEYLRYAHSNEVVGYTIRISELLRGDDAMQLALTWNSLNSRDFPEDKDLILFKVEFTLSRYSSDRENDPEWLASRVHFDNFNGDYSSESSRVSIVTRDGLHAQLFEGASTSGWLYTVADKSDLTPLVRHDDRVWLSLSLLDYDGNTFFSPPEIIASTIADSTIDSTAELGERSNPVPIGEEFTTEYLRYAHSNEVVGYTIRISELLRGDDAMQLALTWNSLNSRDFPEDKDLILYKVEFTLNRYSSDRENDPEWLASRVHFDNFNGDYSSESSRVSIVTRDGLHAQLFEGASTSGWLYTVADKSDLTPLVRHDDRLWFALYEQ